MLDITEIQELMRAHGVQTVILAGTDPVGVLRGKRISVPYFLKCYEEGVNFSSYIMSTTTMDEVLPGVFDTGVPDVRGIPDLQTFRLAPWEPHTAICLMDWHYPDGTPHPCCPRGELKRQVAKLRAQGLDELFSLELEFYLFPMKIDAIRAGGWADISRATGTSTATRSTRDFIGNRRSRRSAPALPTAWRAACRSGARASSRSTCIAPTC